MAELDGDIMLVPAPAAEERYSEHDEEDTSSTSPRPKLYEGPNLAVLDEISSALKITPDERISLSRKLSSSISLRGRLTGSRNGEPSAYDVKDLPSPPHSPLTADQIAARRAAEEHLAHHSANFFSGWYVPAKQLLQWGEVQKHRHAEWDDLFYDLIMVGFAFQIGLFLLANLKRPEGGLGLVGMGLTTISSWNHRTIYHAKYECSKSPAHRFLDLLEGLLTAAAAHQMVVDLAIFELVHMYTFVACVITTRGVLLVRRFEVVHLTRKSSEGPLHKASIEMVMRMLLEMAVLSVAFSFKRATSIFLLLIGVWVLNQLMHLMPLVLRRTDRAAMVPLHVQYMMLRLGEMVMLMLGEGVLSLVLATAPAKIEYRFADGSGSGTYGDYRAYDGELNYGKGRQLQYESTSGIPYGATAFCGELCYTDMLKEAVSFVSSFFLLSALMFLYYRSNPTEHGQRHHHAIRRDMRRGVLWNTLHWPLNLGLIAVGVAIKSVHKYAHTTPPREYVYLLVAACTFSLLVIAVQQLLHPGFYFYWTAPPHRFLRLGLMAVKLLAVTALPCMLWFPANTDAYAYVLYAFALSLLTCVCVLFEKAPLVEAELWAYIDMKEAAANNLKKKIAYHKVLAAASNTAKARSIRCGNRDNSEKGFYAYTRTVGSVAPAPSLVSVAPSSMCALQEHATYAFPPRRGPGGVAAPAPSPPPSREQPIPPVRPRSRVHGRTFAVGDSVYRQTNHTAAASRPVGEGASSRFVGERPEVPRDRMELGEPPRSAAAVSERRRSSLRKLSAASSFKTSVGSENAYNGAFE